jgi:hypothetical protein
VPKASGIWAHSTAGSGPSDQRGTRGARLGSIASSRIATLESKDQLPPIRETRSAESAQELGPRSWRPVTEEHAWGKGTSAHHMIRPVPKRRHHRSRPSKGTRGARSSHVGISPIVTLKHKEQPPPIHETRDVEGVQDSGPQYRRKIAAVHPKGRVAPDQAMSAFRPSRL